jgi:hypothetical protein
MYVCRHGSKVVDNKKFPHVKTKIKKRKLTFDSKTTQTHIDVMKPLGYMKQQLEDIL